MQPDPNLGALAAALSKAQAAFPAIPRDREVTVQMKSGGSYKFKYAPLDTILSAVRAPLGVNGLAITQLLDGTDLVTLLLHESGGYLEAKVALPNFADVQGLGSAVTYLRRYALQAMLGIAAEEDDDGNHASGNTATPTARPRSAAPRAATPVSVAPRAAQDDEEAAAEAYAQAHPQVSAEGIADLHAQARALVSQVFTPDELADIEEGGIAPTGGLTTPELFRLAEEADVPKARLTMAAKLLFGPTRWQVVNLTDEERAQLWVEVLVPA